MIADNVPKIGDVVVCWDTEDSKAVRGRVKDLADDGYVFVRCVDGIVAEYEAGYLRWDGLGWVDPDIPVPATRRPERRNPMSTIPEFVLGGEREPIDDDAGMASEDRRNAWLLDAEHDDDDSGEHLIVDAASAQFFLDDYDLQCRRTARAEAETADLRQLVKDIVKEILPGGVLGRMSPDLWEPQAWQPRARRVLADLPPKEMQP